MIKSHSIGRLIILIILLIAVITFFILTAFNKSIFRLRHVEIKKDFNLDENALIKYLGIDDSVSILSLNDKVLEKKLLNLGFIGEAEVSKKLPGTLKIIISGRKPVALINCADGEVCFIDAGGVIYEGSNNRQEDLVFIAFDKHEKLKPGMILNERYKKICEVLNELKNNYAELYRSVSQIDVIIGDFDIKYFVRYGTKHQTICLKNQINVDSIRKGLVSILYLNENDDKTLIYTENGLALD